MNENTRELIERLHQLGRDRDLWFADFEQAIETEIERFIEEQGNGMEDQGN